MITILVALRDELDETHPALQQFKVIYTGVGKVNAAIHTARAAMDEDCSMIINYGSAGALTRELVGRLCEISIVRQRDMDARPLCDIGITPFEDSAMAGDIPLDAKDGVTLSTGDQFVTSPPALASQLVDMEGYAIAKTAKAFGMPLRMVKYGSDMADENAAADWALNCAKGQEMFLAWVEQYLR